MTLRPETKWSATLVQTVAVVGTLVVAGWYVRGTYEAMIRGQADIQAQQVEIKTQLVGMQDAINALDARYITLDQADRYASAFRWENRSLSISVPDPRNYTTKQ